MDRTWILKTYFVGGWKHNRTENLTISAIKEKRFYPETKIFPVELPGNIVFCRQ